MSDESRSPRPALRLIAHGHEVLVQDGCGEGVGASADAYRHVGAVVLDAAAAVFARADPMVKVNESQERALLRPEEVLFTYLHLAADRALTDDLLASSATCIAYETVQDPRGHLPLPLLMPMSQVAGRLSIQAGARSLEATCGGAGVLLGGVPGVAPAQVVVIGGGMVGSNAIDVAMGMGASVTVLDVDLAVLQRLAERCGPALRTVYSTQTTLAEAVAAADLIVEAVLIVGARASKVLTKEMVSTMRAGAVVVDVAIDQGGCVETARSTTHTDPIYVVDDVVHYCVTNMPGAVPRTSTQALTNATLPYVLRMADHGVPEALASDPDLAAGLNVHRGMLTHTAVADAQGREFTEFPTAVVGWKS